MKIYFLQAAFFSLFVGFVFAGCAGMKVYNVGVPSSSANNFFTQVESAAKNEGFRLSRLENHLAVYTKQGDFFQYNVQNDQIVMTVFPATKGKTKEEIEARQRELKAISDRLVAEAAKAANKAKAFAP